jgi:hypothetical protein
VRFLKFAGSILALFLIIGAFLFGFNLKEATEEVRKTQEEVHKAQQDSKDTELAIRTTKSELMQLAKDMAASGEEVKKNVKANQDEILDHLKQARALLTEIQGSREQARTLLAGFGKPPPAPTGLTSEQADRLVDLKLLKKLRNVLPAEQYAKLEKELKAELPQGLRRAIHDAENRPTLPGRLVRAEGSPTTNDPVVTQVYDNIGTIYGFFKEVFNRELAEDTGGTIRATVHYERDYDNAFWDGQQLVIGDGDGTIFKKNSFGSLSILAAELSHSVINATVELPYQDQPGSLHSHLTDVFAVLTEQWLQKQTVDQATWLVGAGVLAPGVRGVGLRSLKTPGSAYDDPKLGKDPQPDHMNKLVTTSSDNGGVHINSGIPNHAFYLVARALGGRAWEKAGMIWYKSMLNLKPSSSFQEFAQTTYDVACGLYPEAMTEREAVRKAWETVGITVKVKKP